MNNEAWNKIEQTHDLFKKIIAPLKQCLCLNFGYMIVFEDGRYYQLIDNLECLNKWITSVETSKIFCSRNITNYFDKEYNFTLWPNESVLPAMQIYKEYGVCSGITVSKINKGYAELYWFTKEKEEFDGYKFFVRNKNLLLEFINYFETYKEGLHLPVDNAYQELFKFIKGFDTSFQESVYLNEAKAYKINRFQNSLRLKIDSLSGIRLAPREIEILSIISQGYSTKIAAKEMCIATKTAEHYIERIKEKTGNNLKSDLIRFYHKNYLNKR